MGSRLVAMGFVVGVSSREEEEEEGGGVLVVASEDISARGEGGLRHRWWLQLVENVQTPGSVTGNLQ